MGFDGAINCIHALSQCRQEQFDFVAKKNQFLSRNPNAFQFLLVSLVGFDGAINCIHALSQCRQEQFDFMAKKINFFHEIQMLQQLRLDEMGSYCFQKFLRLRVQFMDSSPCRLEVQIEIIKKFQNVL